MFVVFGWPGSGFPGFFYPGFVTILPYFYPGFVTMYRTMYNVKVLLICCYVRKCVYICSTTKPMKATDLIPFALLASMMTMGLCARQIDPSQPGGTLRPVSVPYQYDLMRWYDIPRTFGFREIDTVCEVAYRYEIPQGVIFRLIALESEHDSAAVNDKYGCFGYMQLNPAYFKPCNRFENIRQGVAFIRAKQDELGSLRAALNYYGSGSNMAVSEERLNKLLNQ